MSGMADIYAVVGNRREAWMAIDYEEEQARIASVVEGAIMRLRTEPAKPRA